MFGKGPGIRHAEFKENNVRIKDLYGDEPVN
jgi:hypothetical protein